MPGYIPLATLTDKISLSRKLRIAFNSTLAQNSSPSLTLFPRVSETSETNLRNQRFPMLFGHIIHPRAVL